MAATLVGIGVVVFKACIFHKCPVCQWNTLAWLAAAAIVVIFAICCLQFSSVNSAPDHAVCFRALFNKR